MVFCGDDTERVDGESICFSPPLYLQRDEKIISYISSDVSIKKVLDIGCASCRLISKLKRVEHLEVVNGVDVDRSLLLESVDKLKPLAWDYLFPKPKPLSIKIFYGNILNQDTRLLGCDAVILSEVIEHLYEPDLEKLPNALFSQLKPRICIITTPNSEYNVLFPNMTTTFRHYDHKFEWTKKEFTAWCDQVAKDYSYTYELDGVGAPPAEQSHIGFCTQIAIFTKLEVSLEELSCDDSPCITEVPYEMIEEIIYPFKVLDQEDEKKKILDRIHFIMSNEAYMLKKEDLSDENAAEAQCDCIFIPIQTLLENSAVNNYFKGDFEFLKKFLTDELFKIVDDNLIKYQLDADVTSSEDEY